MKASLDSFASKKKSLPDQNSYCQHVDLDDVEAESQETHASVESAKGKKIAQPSKRIRTLDSMLMPRTTPGAQPRIKSVLQGKAAKEKVDLEVAKWMIDAFISFNAANSPYFQTMFDAACSFGAGYKAPSFYQLRGCLLTKNVARVKDFVDSFCQTWKETGCTITADGWTDQQRRTLINFLVCCPKAIFKAREDLVKMFQRKKARVEPYLKIIDSRWDNQLCKRLHAAGFWFNPCYQYDAQAMEKHRSTLSALLDVCERYAHGKPDLMSKLTRESHMFRKVEGDFGRLSVIRDRASTVPDQWWTCYGNDVPNLQKLAIRVLSQTCSASGCERNWSIFEHIHSKKRNRLEHQRLNDLVYVHYNLRLQQRCARGRNYDPIEFGKFSENDTWILEDEPPILTVAELENFRKDLPDLNATIEDVDKEIVDLDQLDTGEDEECEITSAANNAQEENEDQSLFGGHQLGDMWERS